MEINVMRRALLLFVSATLLHFSSVDVALSADDAVNESAPLIDTPTTPAPTPAAHFTFADIPWGSTPVAVSKMLAGKGFAPKYDQDGDVTFTGSLMGQQVAGIAFVAGTAGLQKIVVTLITADNDARRVYRDLRASLIEKYGAPSSNHEFFERPYYDGDGYERTAFRAGKAHFLSLWKRPGGILMTQITERLTVRTGYEGPQWANIVKERRLKDARVF